MQTSNDLKTLLSRIDRRGYPAYKDTRGTYQFPGYVLSIDHVQGDPFAAPSKLSIHVDGRQAGFPQNLYRLSCQRIALQDELTRRFALGHPVLLPGQGSGHSGLISISRCGQEVLERTACQLNPNTGGLILRLEVGFPANGRTIQCPGAGENSLRSAPPVRGTEPVYRNLNQARLQAVADLAEDQQYIRDILPQLGLCAFLADGSILPRAPAFPPCP